jgi:AmmeMemoRadiSam system protein B/AmmeMemoRadiSam system protein A
LIFTKHTKFRGGDMLNIVQIFLIITSHLFSIGPFVSGSFYPQEKKQIELFISEKLEKAKTYTKDINPNTISSVIVPHAGYIYSGQIAAISYSVIPKDTERFIIISPSHRVAIDGAAIIRESFLTPLGSVETDTEFINILLKEKIFEEKREAFNNEHSIEVQLPFIQYLFKKPQIVPILVNTEDISKLTKISQIIYNTIKTKPKKTIIIISSDFSHYPNTNTSILADKTMIEAIKTLDENYIYLTSKILLSKDIPNLDTAACGLSAIIVGTNLSKLMGAKSFIPIKNSNSYLETNNEKMKDNVVGYVSGVFTIVEKKHQYILKKEDKTALLKRARNSIMDLLSGKRNTISQELHENVYFNLPKAVFVTLTLKDKGYLRGCMGTTHPQMSLYDAVAYFAQVAASEDPRFRPVEIKEMDNIKIEISILSNLKKVNDYKDIKKGDGVVLITKQGSGLFLPQVWKQLPNKEDFLSELCYEKAGVDKDCWKRNETQFYIFSVESFEE